MKPQYFYLFNYSVGATPAEVISTAAVSALVLKVDDAVVGVVSQALFALRQPTVAAVEMEMPKGCLWMVKAPPMLDRSLDYLPVKQWQVEGLELLTPEPVAVRVFVVGMQMDLVIEESDTWGPIVAHDMEHVIDYATTLKERSEEALEIMDLSDASDVVDVVRATKEVYDALYGLLTDGCAREDLLEHIRGLADHLGAVLPDEYDLEEALVLHAPERPSSDEEPG